MNQLMSKSVRKWMSSRRHSLWILLILLLVTVAIQTFVVRQTRNDRLTALPRLRFPVFKQRLLPTLQSALVGLQFETSLAVQQDTTSKHTRKTADRNLQDKEHGKASDDNLSIRWNKFNNGVTSSQVEKRHFLPKQENKASTTLPGSLVLHSTRTGLSPGPDKKLLNTPPVLNSTQSEATCQPTSHIFFLKTHKTASSTILNILYRYGESRNLTFALPLNKHSQLFYPYYFAPYFVEGFSSRSVREFHIMCNHMRFNKAEVAKVMPEDTFYFSILRHPVDMMESIFIYFKSISAFHQTPSLDDFLDNSEKYYNPSAVNSHYAHNVLAFDFGFENNIVAGNVDLEKRVTKAIAAIEKNFHLILISEYFDESMILLKHALCWSLSDVVSFRLNSRSERTRHTLSANTAEKIKRWNALDWRIYLHFNTTFWKNVDTRIGQKKMQAEVSELRKLQAKMANSCLKDGGAVHPSQVKDARLKPFQYGAAVIQGYNLKTNLDPQTKTICQKLITPELQYTDRLYTKQFPLLAVKHSQANTKVAQQRQLSETSDKMLKEQTNRQTLKNSKTLRP